MKLGSVPCAIMIVMATLKLALSPRRKVIVSHNCGIDINFVYLFVCDILIIRFMHQF